MGRDGIDHAGGSKPTYAHPLSVHTKQKRVDHHGGNVRTA